MIAIAVTLKALMAQLPPTQCSAVTSYDHQTGYNMENDPESPEGERLSNIRLFDWKEFRFVVIGRSNWHTDCSGPNFDPSSLSTHVKLLELLNHFTTTSFTGSSAMEATLYG